MPTATASSTFKPHRPRLDVSCKPTQVSGSIQPITNRDGQVAEFCITLKGKGLAWLVSKVCFAMEGYALF